MKTENKLLHFSKYLEQIARKHGRFDTFDDFLTLIVCCLSMGQEEKQYFRTIGKYAEDERELLCKAFASVVVEMEEKPFSDPFGDYFQEYLSNGKNGQFFTPEHICEMMVRMVYNPDECTGNKINDPCCGSGRMFLAYAQLNRGMYFVGSDISAICCKMTLINMCLNSLNGEVYHMNSITLEVWRKWLVIVDPCTKIPCIYEIKEEQAPQAATPVTPPELQPLLLEVIPQANNFLIFSPNN